MAVGNRLKTLMREREHAIEKNDSEDSSEPLIYETKLQGLIYTYGGN